ncbi:MAG TPA: hypothetical protein VFV34_16170, partial [Blastocatellia bacterium]|nr:hypothetical protein [Blastocatellia bacterium]
PDISEFPDFRGTRIRRRESGYPTAADQVVFDDSETGPGSAGKFSDAGLKGNTVYYYSIVAYDQVGNLSAPSLASALATTSYETANQLYSELPALYSMLDTVVPPDLAELDPEDRQKGQLRRLVELFSSQFDLIRSYTAATRDFSDVNRIDGGLIQLLADWIGWQTDFTLPLSKQRNEVNYAPHFHRTTGIAANLRATLNRLTTWDAQVKEFVHNVFITNAPEQLFIQEAERLGDAWPEKPRVGLVTLDVASYGRPAVVGLRDGRSLLLYHTRETVQRRTGTSPEQWHIWYKAFDQTDWLAARRLTFEGESNKYPSLLETGDRNVWVFWSGTGANETPAIKLMLMSAGRPAHPPRLRGAKVEPFALADGNKLNITIDDGSSSIFRQVLFRPEDFRDITKATAEEVVAVLNRELPGADVAVENAAIVMTSTVPGAASKLSVPPGPGAAKLGLGGPTVAGGNASRAELIGRATDDGLFNFSKGDRLVIRVDDSPSQAIVFRPGKLSVSEVAAAINSVVPGVATEQSGALKLSSPGKGEASRVSIDVDASTAARELGFGAPLPPVAPDSVDSEPAVLIDNSGNIWLFWSSRPAGNQQTAGSTRIWYNRFDVANRTWGAAKQLTSGPDCEPAVAFDPGNGAPGQGKIWVFWSRKTVNDRWNIFYRTTTKIDFETIGDADWEEKELTPVQDHDRKEPGPLFAGAGKVELYFSSNRADGWHVWLNTLSPNPEPDDHRITSGQFTCRAPAAMKTSAGVRLWFRNNASQVYTSPSYPASQTIDARYAGSTTADTRNATKTGLRGNLQDVLRYTYDTGREEDDWYARDTVGIYLTPDTDDEKLVLRKQSTLANVVRRFLPIQVRAVFIIQQIYPEFVYTYARPGAAEPRFIGEQMIDKILSETYTGPADSFRDRVNFKFTRTWQTGLPKKGVIDLAVLPPDLSFRLFMRDVEEGV